MEQQEEYISVEVDHPSSIASRLQKKLVDKPPITSNCCIYKAPGRLRRRKDDLYRPSLASIGPYHRRNEKLQPMEGTKLWYLKCLLSRAPAPEGEKLLERMVATIRAQVDYVRDYYEEKQELPQDDGQFVEMMVVDGCFLIEYFRKQQNLVPKGEADPIFQMSWMRKTLVVDMLLLENQLPWFVMDRLYQLTLFTVPEDFTPASREVLSLPQLSHNSIFWDTLREKPIPDLDESKLGTIKHLLDLHRKIILYENEGKQPNLQPTLGEEKGTFVRNFLSPGRGRKVFSRGREENEDKIKRRFISTPSVKELLQAGISIEVREGNDLTKIEFSNGVLKIPRVQFIDNAEVLFRNLIAYEQCDGELGDKVTSYAAFLDNLIDSKEDLEKLREKKIVVFYLSSEDVSSFFDGLYIDAHIVKYTYKDLSKQICKYCEYSLPKWRVILKRDYFSNPWSGISVIAGIILMFLTFLQTYYAVMQG